MPEETGKSKVASWLTSQSSTSANQSVKVEGGMKTEKKVIAVFHASFFLFYFSHEMSLCSCFCLFHSDALMSLSLVLPFL